MNRTAIEWCDYTWNPVTGCSPISAGCEHCYAAAISKRFAWHWGSAKFHADRLLEPLKVRKPSRIFVCSMGDLGHETVRPEWRLSVYDVMKAAAHHTYIILTKRPKAFRNGLFPRKTWVGVTIESQEQMERWNTLLYSRAGCVAACKFVSIEPMLGPVTFAEIPERSRPAWVIAGPETGPSARPCKDEWIDALAAESRVFFDKRKTGWKRREFPCESS